MTHPYIEHLLKDHKKQRKLEKKLVKAETREDKEKYRQKLYDALYPHIEGENASIFDFLVKKGDEAKAGALEAMQEHHVDRILLDELMALDVDDEVFIAKAKVLREVNNHHLKEEEKEHFPLLESLASEEELDALFEAYESAEHEVEE
jgi:hemerythrin-like domain-containing protein